MLWGKKEKFEIKRQFFSYFLILFTLKIHLFSANKPQIFLYEWWKKWFPNGGERGGLIIFRENIDPWKTVWALSNRFQIQKLCPLFSLILNSDFMMYLSTAASIRGFCSNLINNIDPKLLSHSTTIAGWKITPTAGFISFLFLSWHNIVFMVSL